MKREIRKIRGRKCFFGGPIICLLIVMARRGNPLQDLGKEHEKRKLKRRSGGKEITETRFCFVHSRW